MRKSDLITSEKKGFINIEKESNYLCQMRLERHILLVWGRIVTLRLTSNSEKSKWHGEQGHKEKMIETSAAGKKGKKKLVFNQFWTS